VGQLVAVFVLAPVVRIALQRHVVVSLPLDELKRTRAGSDRVHRQVGAGLLIAVGLRIMPARSTSCASSVPSGRLRSSTTVAGSFASTESTEDRSLLRTDLGSVM